MGTTGTIMGVSKYLSQSNRMMRLWLQPTEGQSIPGIRRWPEAYLPKIYDPSRVDRILDIDQAEAESMMRRLAREERMQGLFRGSIAGARISQEVEHATIVAIICDRTGIYQPVYMTLT